MNVYVTELKNSASSLTFPTMPESISVRGSAKYQSYEIISKGTIKIPRGIEPSTIEMRGRFFGKQRKKSVLVQSYTSPKNAKSILRKWRDSGTVLRLLVTETGINYDVTIESFEWEEIGAHQDITYSISFVKYYDFSVTTGDDKKSSTRKERPNNSKSTGYVVKKGDNLWKIAKSKLGKSSRWEEIYNLNKATIEAEAKKRGKTSSSHGHWIYPGTKLKLPG